jgi:hypothetical protein
MLSWSLVSFFRDIASVPVAAAYLFLVRSMGASPDPRFSIWDVLHDGEITIMQREQPDSLLMFVSIPYVRRRIQPLGDSFRLRLDGFRGMLFSHDNGGESYSDLDYVEGFEILEAKSETMPVAVQLTAGTLMLDFDSLEISLDTGQAISYEDVWRAAEDYWTEFGARAKEV